MSIKHKFIFVHIPKTAGNCIQNALIEYTEDEVEQMDYDGVNYHGITVLNSMDERVTKHAKLRRYRANLDDYFKFTVMRNPLDRMMSWHFFNMRLTGKRRFDEREFISFLTMCSFLGNNYSPQVDFLEPGVDLVIRFDNLQQGFDTACEKIGIPTKKLIKVNQSANHDYREFYTDKTREMVYDIYHKDFKYYAHLS